MTEFEATLANEECVVNVTISSIVRLCKLYGPLDFCDIRVRLDFERCQWIIEKEDDIVTIDGELIEKRWLEVARVDGQ